MASINGLGGMSSIYGNRNVISGLASGMDTESMIENAISGIKMKISGLNQKRTRVTWQQQSLRNIIDKMANFSQKYTSYTSGTNLMSGSFFNNAVKTTTGGKYADMVSATGKTNSDVQILGVEQLARAATYRISGIGGSGGAISGEAIDLAGETVTSNMTGTLTLKDGDGRSVELKFEAEDMEKVGSAEDFKKLIDDKLKETKVGDSGDMASKYFATDLTDGKLTFKYADGATVNKLGVEGSGDLAKKLADGGENKPKMFDLSGMKNEDWLTKTSTAEKLEGKEVSFTLNGMTKKITLNTKNEKGETLSNAEFMNNIQKQLDDKFGKDNIKVTDTNTTDTGLSLSFAAAGEGNTLAISGGKVLGLETDNETSYMNNSMTLGRILKGNTNNPWDPNLRSKAVGEVKEFTDKNGEVYYKDEKGNKVVQDGKDADGNPLYYRVDDKGEYMYDFIINGKTVGSFSENSTMENVVTAINNNADSDVTVSYSKLTNEFKFTAKESGSQGKIEFHGNLARSLFGDYADYPEDPNVVRSSEDGQDAKLSVKINGTEMDLVRKDNNFDLEGLNVTLKGTFTANKGEEVTFTSTSDSEKIVGAIKDMVRDYNEMVGEIRKAYTTMPSYKSNGQRYEPLTDEERADLSEDAAKAYEENAKNGILFADRDLSRLYSQLTDAIGLGGKDGSILRSIGIETSYNQGATTLTVNEEKLKAALENNPDQVRDIFTKSRETGSSTDGLMASISKTVDEYAKTTGSKGILVERAGSVKSPATLHNNAMQEILNNFDKQIDKWTTKMADQVDSYTRKFSQLEQLIAQMNSQSSSMAGLLMGGQQ